MLAILVSNAEVYSLFSVKECHDYGKLWQIKKKKNTLFPITKELFPLKDIPDYVDLYITIRNLITCPAYDFGYSNITYIKLKHEQF